MSPVILAIALVSPAQLDRITVTARHDAASRPEAVAELDARTVARTAASHPNELFNRVPGAWISRGSGQEQLTAIRSPVLTGTGACAAFAVLEDGVPIRPSAFCNVNNLFELNTEQAGVVEVLRGPGAVVLGSNALHGAIAVQPRRPGAAPARALGLEGGPHGYRRVLASWAESGPGAQWRIDGYGVSTGSFRDQEGFDQQKLSAQLSLPQAWGAPRMLLSASNLNQETAGFVTGLDAFRDDRRFRNENPEAFRDASAFRLQARFEWPLADGTLAWVPYVRADDMRFLQHFIPGKPLEQNDSRSAGSQWMWRFDGALRGQVGFDIEFARGSLLEDQAAPLTDSSPLQNAIRPQGRHYDYTVDTRSLAWFGELEHDLGERTTALAGLRYERLRLAYDNRASDGNLRDDGTACGFGGCLFNRPADRVDRFDEASAQLGVQHALGRNWQLSARYARGFRFPQAGELYRLQRGQDVADLRPETLQGPEAGVVFDGEDFRIDLRGFAYEKRNVILRDAQGFNISDGRTRHRGGEADWRWTPGDAIWLEGNASYSVQRYRFDRAIGGGETIVRGNEIDTAPRWLGGLRAGHDGMLGRFELEWVHQGGYFLDAANTARYDGHDLLNLRWSKALAGGLSVSARLINLTDRRYAERADAAFGQFRYFPGAGRELFVALNWQR
jgi:outer membrane receptor protein involved in Fe transport